MNDRNCATAECVFHTLSEHRTSLGLVRYQMCTCGRMRILQGAEVVATIDRRDRARHPRPSVRRSADRAA